MHSRARLIRPLIKMNGASRINRAREEREVDASQETRAPPARAHLSRLYDRCGTVRVPRIIWHASLAAHEYSLYVYICAYICIEYRPTSSKRWRNDGWERRWAKRTELGRWFVYIDADRTLTYRHVQLVDRVLIGERLFARCLHIRCSRLWVRNMDAFTFFFH